MKAKMLVEAKSNRVSSGGKIVYEIFIYDDKGDIISSFKVGENVFKDTFMAIAEQREINRAAGTPNV